MSNVEITVPDLGVDTAVEVIEICIKTGQEIAVDDPVVVLESDKATMEIPALEAGKVDSIAVSVGDKVSQGDLLMKLTSSESSNDQPAGNKNEVENENEDESDAEEAKSVKSVATDANASDDDAPAEQESSGGEEEIDVVVPDVGGAEDVEVIEIMVAEGDSIEEDQTILVLESDKASMEIPSPSAGVLTGLAVKVGDKLSEGSVIGKLKRATGASDKASSSAPDQKQAPVAQKEADYRKESGKESGSGADREQGVSESSAKADRKNENVDGKASGASVQEPASSASNRGRAHAGPAVRKLARELGLDLTRVKGSGRKGRVLKDDVKNYVKTVFESGAQGGENLAAVSHEPALPDFSAFGETEVRDMEKLQKLTAANMQRSWSSVPHVTQFDQADITELEIFRKSKKAQAEGKSVKLTPLPFILKCCASALREYPQFNVSIDMRKHTVIRKKYVNIGIAVDTPAGLVVPVIRNVDQKNIWQLAEECQQLAAKARERKLSPSEMQGGCFTISSLGSIGGTAFTPIVNAPEVAILGVSKAEYQPRYNGREFEARLMLPLSLSYDHRAVNGVDGANFAAYLARSLSDLREILF